MILLGTVNDEPCDSCNTWKNVSKLTATNERKKESYHLHLCDLCLDVIVDLIEDNKPSYRMDEDGHLTLIED